MFVPPAGYTVEFSADGYVAQQHTVQIVGGSGLELNIQLVPEDLPPPNLPPTALWTYQCDANITCTFDATSSSDPDGTIVLYEWLVPPSGAVVRTGATFVHTFEASFNLTLTLRVTDDDGATGSLTRTVAIGPNLPGGPTDRDRG